MSRFETTVTVDEQGQIRVAGVPFATGTKVEVTITPAPGGAQAAAAASDRTAQLFAALNQARNTAPIAPLRREELYDRKVLR